eukprot:TRINITY_DN237_c0_g1_i5.p1 TRINITY_DN237_c0_g1~~TRINITY_DN237_c0_g1_i5.p1  ORF type:complete len:449 (+),score=101.39 TRINITY_DN237_c0_g1_i5:553-1899(+)
MPFSNVSSPDEPVPADSKTVSEESKENHSMRKYGKWVLTLGLLAATPGMTLAAGAKSKADEKPAAEKNSVKEENQKVANEIAKSMKAKKVQGDISIDFRNGVATLSGSVADPKMRDKAQEAVGKVGGVTRIDNRLTVAKPVAKAAAKPAEAAPAAAGGVVSANHMAAPAAGNRVQQVNHDAAAPSAGNQDVANQVGAALSAASLDGYDIEIRVQNGVALLSGSVGTQAERATASQVVQQVPGIRSVANRLTCTQEPAMAAAPQQGPYGPPQGQYGPPPQGPYGPPQGQYQPQQGQFPPQQGQYPPRAQMYPAGYRQDAGMPGGPGGMPPQGPMGGMPQGAMPMGPGGAPMMPPSYGQPGAGASQASYNNPSLPDYAWPTYAQYPNSAAVNYPTQYSASAFPYIGPFYPYPQVPLGWRDATLRWDDGQWNLMFRTRTDKWWWYFNPNNW